MPAKSAVYIPTQAYTADITGGTINKGQNQDIGFICHFTGTDIIAAMVIQTSVDNVLWADWSSTAVAASADKAIGGKIPFQYVRIFADWTSGTGNITVQYFIPDSSAATLGP